MQMHIQQTGEVVEILCVCFDFHTSNIQRAQTERLVKFAVRSGNPILRSPVRAFGLRKVERKNAECNDLFFARKRYFVLQRPFLPYLFPQEGKDMVAEGTVTASL